MGNVHGGRNHLHFFGSSGDLTKPHPVYDWAIYVRLWLCHRRSCSSNLGLRDGSSVLSFDAYKYLGYLLPYRQYTRQLDPLRLRQHSGHSVMEDPALSTTDLSWPPIDW